MLVSPGTEVRVAGGIDTWDPDAPVGPAELAVWVRLPDVRGDPSLGEALLAYATDGFLIATAMRPHEGMGQKMAHRSVATGVVSHTLTFHDRFPSGEWLRLADQGIVAGRRAELRPGLCLHRGGPAGGILVQESLIRDANPQGSPPTERRRTDDNGENPSGETRMLIDGELVPAGGQALRQRQPGHRGGARRGGRRRPPDMDRAIAAARRAFDETDWATDRKFRQQCLPSCRTRSTPSRRSSGPSWWPKSGRRCC